MGAIDKVTRIIEGIKTDAKEPFETRRGNGSSENPELAAFVKKPLV